jgi:hypothetical protein
VRVKLNRPLPLKIERIGPDGSIPAKGACRWFVAPVKENNVWYGVGIIGLIIWIAIAFWPARVARRKGHSFVGYFLLSLLFSPLSLIIAYLAPDRRKLAIR